MGTKHYFGKNSSYYNYLKNGISFFITEILITGGQLNRDGISNKGNGIGGLKHLLGVSVYVCMLCRVDWKWGWYGQKGPDGSCRLVPHRVWFYYCKTPSLFINLLYFCYYFKSVLSIIFMITATKKLNLTFWVSTNFYLLFYLLKEQFDDYLK